MKKVSDHSVDSDTQMKQKVDSDSMSVKHFVQQLTANGFLKQ